MRSLVYFVATSLDGFIAGPNDAIDAFPMEGEHIETLFREFPETLPAPALAARGITPENRTFDTVVMGWNTFAVGAKVGLRDPYPHLRQYVFSRSRTMSEVTGEVTVTKEDPVEVVRRLKSEPSPRSIWLCGGGRLAAALHGEIDALVLKVNPVLLGAGVPLFVGDAYAPRAFELASSRAFASGVVMNRYVARAYGGSSLTRESSGSTTS